MESFSFTLQALKSVVKFLRTNAHSCHPEFSMNAIEIGATAMSSIATNTAQRLQGLVGMVANGNVAGWLAEPEGATIKVYYKKKLVAEGQAIVPLDDTARYGPNACRFSLPFSPPANEVITQHSLVVTVVTRSGEEKPLAFWRPLRLAMEVNELNENEMRRFLSEVKPLPKQPQGAQQKAQKAYSLLLGSPTREEGAEDYLVRYAAAPEYAAIYEKYVRHKWQAHRRLDSRAYGVASLGELCHAWLFIGVWALRRMHDVNIRLPFDLGRSPTRAVLHLLRTDFTGYADPDKLTIADIGGIGDFFSHKTLTGLVFNHDPAVNFAGEGPEQAKAKFAAVLRWRMALFQEVVTKEQTLFLHHALDNAVSPETIKGFHDLLDGWERRYGLKHKLLIYHLTDGQESAWDDGTVFVRAYPSSRKWSLGYQSAQNRFTPEFCAFECALVDQVADIVCEHFPLREDAKAIEAEASVTLSGARTAAGAAIASGSGAEDMAAARRVEEIAAEYVVQDFLEDAGKRAAAHRRAAGIAEGGSIGAVVMNGNPFTLGHRWLIEQAAARVDQLLVFVVEEDLSYFPFKDRFALAQQGTADLNNVLALRSGKFIISTLTFSVYFAKDNPEGLKFDASTDVLFFAKHIAPALGIGVRFVGSEPMCPITGKYNLQMAETLPQYGVRLEVLKRRELGGQAISASWVRALLEAGELPKARPLVPDSTYAFLQRFARKKRS